MVLAVTCHSEGRVLGSERGPLTGYGRKLLSEKLRGENCLANHVWLLKSRRMRWAVHATRMG